MSEFSFQSDLANMLFDTPADPARGDYEEQLVERFKAAIEVLSSRELFRASSEIDLHLIPKLSGRNFLAIAKLIELRVPAAIEAMPRLRAQRNHARRAAELAQILSPLALERVIEALRSAEANR